MGAKMLYSGTLHFLFFSLLFLHKSLGESPGHVEFKDSHHVRISVCSLASYENVASDVRELLQSKFLHLEVSLVHYPLEARSVQASNAFKWAKVPLAAMALLSGFWEGSLFRALGFPTLPVWYAKLSQNKLGAAIAIWVAGGAFQSHFLRTGAFEVYLDDHLIYSRLKEGRFPIYEDLVDLVASKIGQTPLPDPIESE